MNASIDPTPRPGGTSPATRRTSSGSPGPGLLTVSAILTLLLGLAAAPAAPTAIAAQPASDEGTRGVRPDPGEAADENGHGKLAATASPHARPPRRPVSTYSIVARDPATGQMGVAVQSHWYSVGAIVPWAEAGVGAVATQSFVEPAYGPLGLELMRLGRSAPRALEALVSTDADRAVRQVAMVDAGGNVAVHTGELCIRAAGHRTGEQYSVQANLMDRDTVWDAMAAAYEGSDGDLAERLLAALEAAQAEGGDIRGKQSAAILVVAAEPTGKPWVDRMFDLRVEDHPKPVAELRRLVRLQRAYHKLNEGDEWVTRGDLDRAMEAYLAATEIVPDEATNGEAAFWVGVTLADAGRVDEAIPFLARAHAQDDRWARLLPRLPESELLPDDPELIERLLEGMRRGEDG